MQAICRECGKECLARLVDNGIGVTEAWGIKTFLHEYAIESDCCDSVCMDEEGNEITVDDYEEYTESERDYFDEFNLD